MIDAPWCKRIRQSLEFAAGFELFVLVGPGGLAKVGLERLAGELEDFGAPRWHPLQREGIEGLIAAAEPGVLHFVHGLEHMSEAAARGVFARLNLARQSLLKLGAPVFLWVPEGYYESLLRQAPDLMSWRSQIEVLSADDLGLAPAPAQIIPPARASDEPPRVFISYSHDPDEHRERVLALAQRLRGDGVDAWLDRFEPAPAQGWPRWLRQQLERADLVLVVCTADYRLRFEGKEKEGAGIGAAWEGMLLAQYLYEHGDPSRYIPVAFAGTGQDVVPTLLAASTLYILPDSYDALYRRLVGSARVVPLPMGAPKVLEGIPAVPGPAAQLDLLREELARRKLAGEDTSALVQRMLSLRRELRNGPRLQAGDVLGDRYRLGRVIGRGGFAEVWQAHDLEAERVVAIKVLHRQWAGDRSKIERFRAGVQLLERLRHPGIVRILGGLAEDEDHHYFVMPLYGGGDLSRASVDRETALFACAHAFEGLAYLHDHGIVHRDVKPSNILLDDEGRGVITDCDLAWAADSTHGTRTGVGLGTFVYAAPEQLADAGRVDARTDVYGAGMCVLFVLLGANPPALVSMTQPGLLDTLPCSDELRELLRRAVTYDREARTTTCAQLAAALRQEARLGPPAAAAARAQPDWSEQGTDEHGAWASIHLGQAELRMRWIPPGNFLMGSPTDEPGRFDNEGPQHPVAISEGFWLAQTPCTQALWQEITGSNPSRFPSPTRPVEEVSWDDVQRFLVALADRVGGPPFRLPTEAQWEYACRAGTKGATYLEDADGPERDRIAWTWQNSGGTTHAVAQLEANAWGLHDMLGNVWEWCADGPRRYDARDSLDPQGPSRGERVRRGGSWGSDARFARCACRMSHEPGDRYGSVGFRLLRVGPRPT